MSVSLRAWWAEVIHAAYSDLPQLVIVDSVASHIVARKSEFSSAASKFKTGKISMQQAMCAIEDNF